MQVLRQDGAVVESDADNLAELERRIDEFVRERYPILCRLQVVAT